MAGDDVPRILSIQADGEHRPTGGRALVHETPAQDDDLGGLIQRKDARDASGGDFTDTVADDGSRLDSPGFPQLGKAHLHGENRRLGNFGLLHPRVLLALREFLHQRKFRVGLHRELTGLDGPPEDWFVAHQFAAHAKPLRPLATHHEDDSRRHLGPRREGGAEFGPGIFERKSAEFLSEFSHRAHREREAVGMVVPPRSQHPGEIGQRRRVAIELRAVVQPGAELPGGGEQRFLRPRGEHQRPGAIGIQGSLVRDRALRPFREKDVGICATEAEGIHPRGAHRAAVGKCFGLRRHPHF